MRPITIITALLVSLLAACSWPAESERKAHEAFRISCLLDTLRYQQIERDGLLVFEATCKPER